MGLIVAYLMMAEKVSVVALFIKSLTIGWSSGSVTELISCLGEFFQLILLEWDDKFFNEFTEVFINELIEGKDHGESNSQDPEVMVRALAAMYKTSIASTNYRILLADFRLSIAKSNYLLQYNHFVSCPQCIRQERCPFTENSFLPAPSGIVRATRNSTHELPVITNASLGNLRLALAPSILIPKLYARSLPLRLGSASSSIGSIATPSILRSSSVGYQPSELEEGGFQAAEARQWTTNSTWPMSISSRPGAFSDAMNWRIDAGVLDDDEDDDDFDEESYSDDFIEDDDESVSGPAPLVIQLPRRHMTPLPPIPRTTASAPATMNPNGIASHSRSASNGKPAISESRSASSLNFDLRELDEQSFSASRASSGFL
ncbi:hypothetical protein BC829DRAFT_391606 [Chytridium lagenaria]|nr:hypothetical protein BC829DRAFT_391606 [Chytridium lagenaria]